MDIFTDEVALREYAENCPLTCEQVLLHAEEASHKVRPAIDKAFETIYGLARDRYFEDIPESRINELVDALVEAANAHAEEVLRGLPLIRLCQTVPLERFHLGMAFGLLRAERRDLLDKYPAAKAAFVVHDLERAAAGKETILL